MADRIRGLVGALVLGSRFSSGSVVRSARMFGVSVSLIAAVFSAAAGYTSMIAYQQKVQTIDARTDSYYSEGGSKQPPNFRVAYRGDRLSDDLSYALMVVQVLNPAIRPPLGLDRWPQPGEVFLSPALLSDGESEGIKTRYGRFAGEISEEGLASPDERFAYIGYSPGLVPESSLMPAVGFGTAYPHEWWGMSLPWNGETAYIFQFPIFFGTLLALVLLPSYALVLTTRRFDADARAQRNRLLQSLGASRSHRLAAAIGEHQVALTFSLLLLISINFWVLTRRTILPLVDYELPRMAIAAHLWAFLAIQFVTFVAVTLTLLQVTSGWRGEAGSKRLKKMALPMWSRFRGFGVFVSVCVAALWVPYFVDSSVGRNWQTTFMLLSVAAIATMPSALRELLPAFGRALSGLGKRTNKFPLFLAGRLLAVNSRSLAPVATLMVVATGMLFQILFMLNAFSAQAQTAVRIADAAAGHLVVADFSKGVGNLEAILDDLPIGVDAAILEVDQQGTSKLFGTPRVLTSLDVSCGSVPQIADNSLLDFAASDVWVEAVAPSACVRQLPLGDGRSFQRLILFSKTPLPSAEVRGAVLRHSLPNTPMSSPLYGFVSSTLASAHQGQWLVFEGLVGAILLLSVLLLGLVDRARDQATRLAQVLALGGTWRLRHTVSVITIGVPIVVSGLSGALLSWSLTRLPISLRLAPEFGDDLALSMAVVVLAAAALATVTASSLADTSAQKWRP